VRADKRYEYEFAEYQRASNEYMHKAERQRTVRLVICDGVGEKGRVVKVKREGQKFTPSYTHANTETEYRNLASIIYSECKIFYD